MHLSIQPWLGTFALFRKKYQVGFETGSHYTEQAVLELTETPLLLPLEC